MKKIELIVPCFNESEVLPLFYEVTSKVMDKLQNYEYSYIFVNDGSRDNTLDIIKGFAEKDEKVKYISFSRNFGKEAAMLSGLRYSSADYVGILDADLQHSPDLIPEMLEALEEGYDVAAAKRTDRKGEAGFKSALSKKFYTVANKITEVEIDDGAQDFRVMKKKVVDAMVSMTEYNRFTKGIFSFVGFKTKWFPHENVERAAGETKWSLRKLLKYAIDGILGFSNTPLKIPMWAGVLMFVLGAICTLGAIIGFIVKSPVLPFILILSVLFVTGGLILVSLGIIGEYIARIYSEVKGRPVFIVDESNLDSAR